MIELKGMNRLPGKTYVVTGSTQGIGRDIALRLVAEGANAVVSGRNAENGKKVEAMDPEHLLFVKCDVSNAADCANLITKAVERFGRIDGLVNNAGIFPRHTLIDTPEAVFDAVQNTNVKGSFFASARAIEQMIRQGTGGSIVNVGSTHWRHGVGPYGISKGAMHTLTHNIARSYADDGIRSNWITVGWVLSEGEIALDDASGFKPETYETVRRISYPKGGRYQTGDDIALAAVYLLSDESSQVTGCDIEVHGGFRYVSRITGD